MTWIHVLSTGEVASPAFYATEAEVDAVLGTGDAKVEKDPLPDDVEPGLWYDSVDDSFSVAPPDSDVRTLREWAATALNQLFLWSAGVSSQGVFHSIADVDKGHDYLYRQFQALYIILNRTEYTTQQKTTYCQMVMRGAADVRNVKEFYDKVHAIDAAPDHPNTWTDPRDGSTVNLNESDELSGPDGLNLLESEIPATVDLAAGTWIPEIS